MLDTSLNALVNRYLGADAETAAGLDEINGRIIRVHIREFELTRDLEIQDRQIFITPTHNQSAFDSQVDVSVASFRHLLVGRSVLDLVKEDRITIEGDTHVVSVLQRVLRSVEIDWEEWLAGKLGDTLGHGVAKAVNSGMQFGQRLRETLKDSTQDYLFEEKKLVPSATEVEAYVAAVDKVRADTDRLEARVQQLKQSRGRR